VVKRLFERFGFADVGVQRGAVVERVDAQARGFRVLVDQQFHAELAAMRSRRAYMSRNFQVVST